MVTITLLNQKGGVGKTSTTHHLGGTLAQLGRRVLLIDNDPQSSLTQGLWGPEATRRVPAEASIEAIHSGREPYPEQVIHPSGVDRIDLVPGSRFATSWNVPDPHLAPDANQVGLARFVADVRDRYDLCLIDCPPNLHLCSWSALVASDCLIVPLQPEDYGAQGIIDVQESIRRVQAGPNPTLYVLGFLITMAGKKAIHRLYEQTLREQYGDLVFRSVVPEAVDFVEAIANRRPVCLTKPKGAAAKAIRAIADELLERIGAGSGTETERGAA
jgi:chromosome partitioning protein